MIASVLLADSRPAATLVMVRLTPAAPTLTVLDGAAPANVYVVPLIVVDAVPTAAAVVDPLPSATSPALLATAFGPIATEFVPVAVLSSRVELAWKYLMPVVLIAVSAEPTLL